MDQTDPFNQDGRHWLRGALTSSDIDIMGALLDAPARPGQRLGLQADQQTTIQSVTQAINRLWPHHRPVRLVSFDKSVTTNWAVPWHQDRIIAVQNRAEVTGFSNWSDKNGIWHCEPPLSVLRDMLFVRVHLDAATKSNGAMEIAVGSHSNGAIPANMAETCAAQHDVEITTAEAGDILVLNMLTLHRSNPSSSPNPRRTLRIDYAAGDLPMPLRWAV